MFSFDEIVSENMIESEVKVINIEEHKRPVIRKGHREKLIKELPNEVVECVLNNEEAVCRICAVNFK